LAADFKNRVTGETQRFVIANNDHLLEAFANASNFELVERILTREEMEKWRRNDGETNSARQFPRSERTNFYASTDAKWFRFRAKGTQSPPSVLESRSNRATADFVTMDTGTGAVHIRPGHGEMITG